MMVIEILAAWDQGVFAQENGCGNEGIVPRRINDYWSSFTMVSSRLIRYHGPYVDF
jgi:hypothetical protein